MIQELCATLKTEAKKDEIDRLVVRAIIEDNGTTLFLKRGKNAGTKSLMYEFPGGRVDADESLDQALRREVLEETGLVVTEIIDCIGSCDFVGSEGEQVREFIFYVVTESGKPVISHEHESLAWFSLPETYEHPIIDHMKGVIKIFWYLALFQSLTRDAEAEGIVDFAVSAAVSNHEKLLLLKQTTADGKALYLFPHGNMEPNEMLFEGLVRIVFNATGLLVTDLVMHLNNQDFVDAQGKTRRQFNFIVEVESLEPLDTFGKENYLWVTTADLEKLNITDEASEIVKACEMIN